MSTHDLGQRTAARRVAPGQYEIEIHDGWQQGRGAFGGLVMAILARAIEDHVAAPERPIRALTGEIPAPVAVGSAVVSVETFRAGQGVTCAAARLVQGGEVRAHAVATLGRTRGDEPAMLEVQPPPMRAWGGEPVIEMNGPSPTFTAHFEFRPDPAFAPFVSGLESRAQGWIRARERGATPDVPYIAALVDAFWPAIFHRLAGPRPAATIAYTLHVASDLAGLDRQAPLYFRGRALVTAQGYSMELRELWAPDGRLVALNPQTFAIIR